MKSLKQRQFCQLHLNCKGLLSLVRREHGQSAESHTADVYLMCSELKLFFMLTVSLHIAEELM